MRRIVLIACLTIAIVGAILFLLTYEPHRDDAVELVSRIVCQNRQKLLYSALLKYHEDHRVLPPSLTSLVLDGYIKKEDLFCPEPAADPNVLLYKYSPENFGEPNLPLIFESSQNHSGKKLRLKKLRPVTIQTMGDGKTIVQNTSR